MSTNHHPQHPQGHPTGHPQHAGSQARPVLVPPAADGDPQANPAADLIRQKLASIYGNEPDARQEMAEAQLPGVPHSKHQQYMLQLHQSGKSAGEIQAAWHQYYTNLNDLEKRQVWQEFYDHSAQSRQQVSRIQPHYQFVPNGANPTAQANPQPAATTATPHKPVEIYPTPTATEPSFGLPPQQQANHTTAAASQTQTPTSPAASPAPVVAPADRAHNPLLGSIASPAFTTNTPQAVPAADKRPPAAIRQQLRDTIGNRSNRLPVRVKHHVQSLLFGLGFGVLTLLIVLFGFFNEVVIAPFIQPSRNVSATPIIISPDGVTASDKNEVIIPKINVEIPLDFSATSTEEKAFEAALDKGVAHYPTTALPGQQGNASFFGHSSNNIFNPGKYKFAFVLLNELVPGDTFYITYNGVAYAYTVYDKKIVEATAVEILNPVPGKSSTAMLVTCDPPGTSLRRLVVWGEQISPNPSSNSAAAVAPAVKTDDSTALPGNGPTLWGRIRDWVTGG
jgi:LPXTG-site transpeptidase (sortase) family protein